MAKTELGRCAEMLATLVQAGDTEFVRKKGNELKKAWNQSYIPSKDKFLMSHMTEEEKALFVTL